MFLVLFYSLFTLLSFLLSSLSIPLTRFTYILITLISLLGCSLINIVQNLKNGQGIIVQVLKRLQPEFFCEVFQAHDLNNAAKKMEAKPQKSPISYLLSPISYLPSLILFLLLSRGLSTTLTPPHNADAGNHFFMISRILETQSLNYTKVYEGYSLPSWYPLGLQNFVAGILSIIGTTDLITFVFPIIFVLASFIPYTIYRFSFQITHHYPTALTASFLSLTFFMFPYNAFSWGGWSIMAGFILLFSALTETIKLLVQNLKSDLPAGKTGRTQKRLQPEFFCEVFQAHDLNNAVKKMEAKPQKSPISYLIFHISCLRPLLPLILFLNALFLTHTTEIVFYLILILPALIIHRQQTVNLIKRFWWVIILNLILLSPFAFAGFSRIQTPYPVEININHYAVNDVLQMLSDFQIATTGNWLYSLLFIAGLGILAWKKQKPLLVINTLSIFILFFTVVLTPYLDPIYRRLFPLLESERLYYLLSPYYSLITAIILGLIFQKIKLLPLKIALATILLILTLPQFTRILHNLQFIASSYSPTSNSDLRLIQKNADLCPVYLNEPVNDAGRFIPYLSTSKVLFHGPSDLLPDFNERLQLIELVASEAAFPKLQEMMVKYPFDCIYAGAYTVHPLTPRLRLPLMLSNPHLNVLDSENGSYILTLAQSEPKLTELPLTILPTDAYALKAHFIGDLGELEYSTENVPFRPVGQRLDLYTKEKLTQITLSGQSYNPTLTCEVLIDGKFHQPLNFTTTHSDLTIKNLNLTGHQTQISLNCPVSPAFIFTKITLE